MSLFDSLSTAIGTKLATLTKINSGAIYDHHTSNLDAFPAVTFEPSSHENTMFTNTDNMRAYVFDIVFYQEFDDISRSTALNILRELIDEAITAFDTDYNLSGACDWCSPIPSSWGEVVDGGGNVLFASMSLVCNAEIAVNT